MKLWTILLEPALDILLKEGVLYYRDPWILEDDEDPAFAGHWEDPFRWIADRLAEKAGPPPIINGTQVNFPLWAWYQWNGEKKARPDLRSTMHTNRGTKAARVEFDIDDNLVLLSDYHMWHAVLNKSYLPVSEEDDSQFDKKLEAVGALYSTHANITPELKKEIEKSWYRALDLSHSDTYITDPMEDKIIQANLWKLEVDQVVKIDRFVGR